MYNSIDQTAMEQAVKTVLKENADPSNGKIIALMEPSFEECSSETNSLTLGFPIRQWQLNPGGIMHGGLITTAFDTTFGTLVHALRPDRVITTVDISTQFLKEVPLNDILLITATANSIGRTLVSLTAKGILKSNGRLAATGVSTFMLLGKRI